MKYFKNIEISKMYNVSPKTVGNWISSTEEGKLDLQLIESNGRNFIINNSHNHEVIKGLSQKGKKYKNKKFIQTIYPKHDFYNIFTEQQIFDIIFNLEVNKEIPHKFLYFGKGAEYWSKYTSKLYEEKSNNQLKNTLELLRTNLEYIRANFKDCKKIRVIDLGPGDGLPVKDILNFLIDNELLDTYIAVDISKEMLDIAEKNLHKEYGNRINFEGYVKDINYCQFRDLTFLKPILEDDKKDVLNLIVFLGGTPANFRDMLQPFLLINESMNYNDMLIFTRKLDSQNARTYFDFNVENYKSPLDESDLYMLNLLNLDEKYYDAELVYNEELKSRFKKIIFKVDLDIEFSIKNVDYKVRFNTNDKVILWRAKHQSYNEVLELFEKCNYEVLQTSRSLDLEQLLVIAKVKENG